MHFGNVPPIRWPVRLVPGGRGCRWLGGLLLVVVGRLVNYLRECGCLFGLARSRISITLSLFVSVARSAACDLWPTSSALGTACDSAGGGCQLAFDLML